MKKIVIILIAIFIVFSTIHINVEAGSDCDGIDPIITDNSNCIISSISDEVKNKFPDEDSWRPVLVDDRLNQGVAILFFPRQIAENATNFDVKFIRTNLGSNTNQSLPINLNFADVSITSTSTLFDSQDQLLYIPGVNTGLNPDHFADTLYRITFNINSDSIPENIQVTISLLRDDNIFFGPFDISVGSPEDVCMAGSIVLGDFSFNVEDPSKMIVLPFDIDEDRGLGNGGNIRVEFYKEGLPDNICPNNPRTFTLTNGEFVSDSDEAAVDNDNHKIYLDITENCLKTLIGDSSMRLGVTVMCEFPLCCRQKTINNIIDAVNLDLKSTKSFQGCDGFDKDSEEYERCLNCLFEDGDPEGEITGAIWTEIGCVDPSPAGIITRIFQIGLGLMGGIAILRVIQIAYLKQQGDPQKVEEASSMLTSLIAGLILMMLGVIILEFLGINVLGLPEDFLGS